MRTSSSHSLVLLFAGLLLGGLAGNAPAVSIQADALPLGAVVYDTSWTWAGAPLEWRVVDTDYAGPGSVTLMAKSSIAGLALNGTGGWNNRWVTDSLRTYLNDTFYNTFSADFKAVTLVTTVPWAIANPVSLPASGTTTDHVFIASQTELGGAALAGDGSVLAWFADSATAAARRADVGGAWYWTRTGEAVYYGGSWYDFSADYVRGDTGAFVAGNWVSDPMGAVPVLNLSNLAAFTLQGDGRYLLTAIPEPATLVLMAALGGAVLAGRRRRSGC